MIVANDVKAQGAGFGTDTNIVTMYRKDGKVIELPILMKKEVAREILKQIEMMLEDASFMKFASVIVDVPARQTDRPFDYIIPKNGKILYRQECV